MNAEDISSRYAGFVVARRWGATMVDTLLFFIVGGCLPYQAPEALRLPLQIALGFLSVLYYPLLEGYTGYTAGKWLLRIKVVDLHGRPPGLGPATIRTLFRLLEVNPFLCGAWPAALCALFSRTRQRFGDMAAHTYVIRDEDLHRIGSPSPYARPLRPLA